MSKPSAAFKVIRGVLCAIFCVFALLPVYAALIVALTPYANMLEPQLFPHYFAIGNFWEAFLSIGRNVLNSFLYAAFATVLTTVIAVPAAYCLARYRFAGRKAVSFALMLTQMMAGIVVLPTRTIPQGITAMLNFDPDAAVDANTINMMAAADKVSTGLITYAARDSEFDGKPIKKGEIMDAIWVDVAKTTYRLARSMVKKDTSFITLISGCDVSEEEAQRTTELVQAKVGDSIEVTLINGGQPVYYYMISVE